MGLWDCGFPGMATEARDREKLFLYVFYLSPQDLPATSWRIPPLNILPAPIIFLLASFLICIQHTVLPGTSVCQVLLFLKGHSTSINKWLSPHRAALQQQCLYIGWEKSRLDFPLTGSVTSCFRCRVTIVPWWDIFSRPHWYKLHLLSLTFLFSLLPSILCYKISGIVTTLYSYYSTLAFSQSEIQSIQTVFSNLRVKPEKHVSFLIDHPSIILLCTVPSNPTRMWHTLGATGITKRYLHSLLFLRHWMCLDCFLWLSTLHLNWAVSRFPMKAVFVCTLSHLHFRSFHPSRTCIKHRALVQFRILQFKGSPPTGMIEPTSQHAEI